MIHYLKKIYYEKYSKKSYSLSNVDLVIERKYLNTTVGTLLNVLLKKTEAQAKQESNVTIDKSLQTAS